LYDDKDYQLINYQPKLKALWVQATGFHQKSHQNRQLL